MSGDITPLPLRRHGVVLC